jgi:hypothetical protein
VRQALVVEGVRERVRPARARPVLEQQLEAGWILALGRVVERFAVVRVGARPSRRRESSGSWMRPAAP